MSSSSVIETDVRERALTWPEQARRAVVRDGETYSAAAELLKGIKALRQEIADTFDPHIRRMHDAHKALLKEKAEAETPLTEAERIIKDALVAFDREQERQRLETQRRLEAEARAQAEADALAKAAAMEREGQAYGDGALVDDAAALLEDVLTAPAPAVPLVQKATPVVAGIAHRSTWSAEVVDLLALVRYVAANPQYLGLVLPNQPALNQQARSLKGAMRIPGVRPAERRDVAAGR